MIATTRGRAAPDGAQDADGEKPAAVRVRYLSDLICEERDDLRRRDRPQRATHFVDQVGERKEAGEREQEQERRETARGRSSTRAERRAPGSRPRLISLSRPLEQLAARSDRDAEGLQTEIHGAPASPIASGERSRSLATRAPTS